MSSSCLGTQAMAADGAGENRSEGRTVMECAKCHSKDIAFEFHSEREEVIAGQKVGCASVASDVIAGGCLWLLIPGIGWIVLLVLIFVELGKVASCETQKYRDKHYRCKACGETWIVSKPI